MSTPTPASAVVAARVFAVPELLEHILLASTIEHEDDEGIRKPARSLFRALRIHRTFKDTIDGSAKLRRLMFLQTCRSSEDTFERRYSPVLWLLGRLGMELDVSDDISEGSIQRLALFPDINFFDQDVEYEEMQYNGLKNECNAFKRRYGAPEASWRNMLVASRANADSFDIQFSINMGYYDDQEDPVFSESAVVAWEFEAGQTIREVWQKYEKLMEILKAKEHGIATTAARRRKDRWRDKDLIDDCRLDLEQLGD